MTDPALDRRQVLAGLGVLAVAPLLGLGACAAPERRAAPLDPEAADRLTELLEGLLRRPDHAAAVGRAYPGAAAPGDWRDTAAVLAERLGWSAETPPEELTTTLVETIRADYRAGRLRSHHGWLLSDTESELTRLIAERRAS